MKGSCQILEKRPHRLPVSHAGTTTSCRPYSGLAIPRPCGFDSWSVAIEMIDIWFIAQNFYIFLLNIVMWEAEYSIEIMSGSRGTLAPQVLRFEEHRAALLGKGPKGSPGCLVIFDVHWLKEGCSSSLSWWYFISISPHREGIRLIFKKTHTPEFRRHRRNEHHCGVRPRGYKLIDPMP